MSEFKKVQEAVQQQFNVMITSGKLFKSSITGKEVWDTYLNAFTDEEDPIFRDPNSTTHNCNNCNNFIRRYGNIISLDENFEIVTLFSNLNVPDQYKAVINEMDNLLKNNPITNVFVETYDSLNSMNYEKCNKTNKIFQLGIKYNLKRYTKAEAELYGTVKPNEIRRFYHFHLEIPSELIDTSGNSIEKITAEYRDKYSVFNRTMEEIPLDTLQLVIDLINQNSILDGTSHLHDLKKIFNYKKLYLKTKNLNLNITNFLWDLTYNMEVRVSKFKNTLIGTLCTELAEGVELNKACLNWNKRVDPANYHKASAPITKKQIEQAKQFVEENGYEESFDRRLATIDDIKASEIKHINVGDGAIKSVSIFDFVKSMPSRHKRSQFDKVEEISIDKFMSDVLPSCTSIEAFLENRMEGNLVTMTTSNQFDSKAIFKWNNNYSWTFKGNLAGKSQIKENVKSAGGKVDGILRFSIQWNDDDTKGIVDFDAHCITPTTEIFYSNKNDRISGGWLDVDMIDPRGIGVENITWQDKSKMKDGKYVFFNRNFNGYSNTGFKAEIEIEGDTYTYQKSGNLRSDTKVATVTLKNGVFSIEHHLSETNSSKELWDLETNNFHKVDLVCLSPNHWGDNKAGNKHYMFMLNKCKCDLPVRGFHNENLISELLTHRKVMEVLGNSAMIEPTDEQLSGLGFNSTVKDELIVKCKGSFNRMLKIKF